jgi:DNA-directed RNA polymerase specialized sigma24 family protein
MMGNSGGRYDGEEQESLSRLIEKELPMLIAMAEARIRFSCSDPADHKKDVVQRAVEKLLQAERNRQAKYDHPAKILHAAIWQEGVSHSKTCLREQAVDFNELSNQHKESADNPVGYSPSELARATVFDSRGVLEGMIYLKERLSKASDPDLFLLHFLEERTLEEIAKKRQWSVMKVQRAVKKLLKELGVDEEKEGPSTPAPDE